MDRRPSPNFAFLAYHDVRLVAVGTQAEALFAIDPAACVAKLRIYGELLAKRAAAKLGLYVDAFETQQALVDRLFDRGAIGAQQRLLFHGLRRAGNEASHENLGDAGEALHQLRMARELGVWFQRSFGSNARFDPGPFVPPLEPPQADASLHEELARLRGEAEAKADALAQAQAELARLAAEAERDRKARLSAQEIAAKAREEAAIWEAMAEEQAAASGAAVPESEALRAENARLAAELAALQAASEARPEAEKAKLFARSARASEATELDEQATRRLIDAALRAAGWEADTEQLAYARGVRPAKNRMLAIAEWPTRDAKGAGRADYVLFLGLTAVGVIEAKRRSKSVPSVLDQAVRYAQSLELHEGAELPEQAPWGKHRVPFVFATNGRPYLRQLETESGIWFRDVRRPDHVARALDGWHTPEGLRALLDIDVDRSEAELAVEPMPYIDRAYQRDAILATEAALAKGQRALLLAMATGTGKTRTCIGLCYRLLKTKRFRRILFLVDRTALGEQTHNALKELRLEHLQTFTDIYDVRGLGDIEPESGTRLHIATVQAMVKRVLGPHDDTSEARIPPVDAYDCVIVDECHRGYVLDKELGERDFSFRDEADYISKYRRVLDHFDAVKIGLTATPAVHTSEIFGAPVYTYSYREAVIDGFLVDHEPPTRIHTRLGKDGLHYAEGELVTVIDTASHTLQKWNLRDDVDIELEGFNREAIVEGWNRAVLGYVAEQIDPALPEATLIFCVDDRHAELVVKILKEELARVHGSVDDEAVKKITGQATSPGELIRRFRNEQYPCVGVTVDLLTTGIDVPRITNLVFLRRVKSRILYEQMLGRATRLCPEIGKERFRIFDAVDLYAELQSLTDMKPVVTNPATSFSELVRQILEADDDLHRAEAIDELVAKLHRKKRGVVGASAEHFEAASGGSVAELIATLRGSSPAEVRSYFEAHPQVGAVLDRVPAPRGYGPIVERRPDSLREVTVGYGEYERPEDYLDAFGRYLREHMNQLPALVAVTQRPRELSRKALRELRLALDQAGFGEAAVQAAWKQSKNEDIAATIVGYVRSLALGSALVPYSERVQRAARKIKQRHSFTNPQAQWLDRIVRQLETAVVIDRESFEDGAFQSAGGYNRIDKTFDHQLEALLGELVDEVWSDAG